MESLIFTTVAIFILGIVVSILTNYLLLKNAKLIGIPKVKEAEAVRWSPTQKPLLGGISFYIFFITSVLLAGVFSGYSQLFNSTNLGVLLATTLGFGLGLADDAYATKPWIKFVGQFLCGIILALFGIVIEISPFAGLNFVFTVLWTVALMNSLNMLDNMDGITTTVSLIVLIIAFSIGVLVGPTHILLLLILAGCIGGLIGFLVYNWHPSKMIMGDSGSQFIGAFTAAVSIIYMWQFRDVDARGIQVRQFVIPCLAFIMPIIDTVTVVIRRLARKQSPFVGGKDHTTHHLAYLGLKDNYVALVFILVSIISAIIIYVSVSFMSEWKYWYTGILVFYCLAVFFVIQILYVKGNDKKLLKSKD